MGENWQEYTELMDGDRPRGFLTTDDRDYLLDSKDFSKSKNPESAEKQQLYRIRRRLRNGIIDFALVADQFPREELEEALEPLLIDRLYREGLMMYEGYSSLLFLFWATLSARIEEDGLASEKKRIQRLQDATISGMQEALNIHTDGLAEVSLSVDQVSIETLKGRFDTGEPLTRAQLDLLEEEDEISEDEREQYLDGLE